MERILNNTDMDKVKDYSMPRESKSMTTAKISRARTMLSQGKTASEVATALGVSVSTLKRALYE